MEKGGISDIVRMKGRYYIFKLDERKMVPKPPFLKIKEKIVYDLKVKKVSELAEKEIEELRKKIAVEVYYDKLTPKTK